MKLFKHVFIILFFVVSCLAPAAAVATETGIVAPDFKLMSIKGQDVSLSEFKGRLVLLKLGTTWCPTCKQLSAEITKIGEFLQEQDAVVLDVFVQDSQEMVENYLGDTDPPMTFHALLDEGQVYAAYNVYVIPRLLVIDGEQIVRFDSAGSILEADEIVAMVKDFNRPVAGETSQ